MAFQVMLTDDASEDLALLYRYIAEHDAAQNADYVLEQLALCLASLSASPERGAYPKELLAVGLREYREIYFKPYRIIYRIIADIVYVMLIADGRRNMQSLLQRRLLAG